MDNSLANAVGFVFLASFFASTLAATPPPTVPTPSKPHETVFQASPLTEMAMGRLQLRFEETSLDDVRAAASVGTIAYRGDAGASIYWLCYTNLNSTPAERLWIVSDGEMGGNEHRVTDVIAQRLPSPHASEDCPSMPTSLAPLKLDNGIWLDTPPQTARKVLGAASSKTGNWESYDYIGKVPGDCAGAHFDLTSSIMLKIVKKQIDSLRVTRITSC